MEDKRRTIIYQIIHEPTGFSYIGQTINTRFTRWQQHHIRLIENRHHSAAFQKLWNEANEDEWLYKVLESNIPFELSNEREYYHFSIFEGKTLNGVTPGAATENTHHLIAEELMKSKPKTYRVLAEEYGVAIGTVGNINRKYVTG